MCSDATITNDPWITSTTEIGFPATTDSKALRAGLNAETETGRSVIVFATYQSSQVVEDALRGRSFRFDLLICDEAHRATGEQSSDFTRALRDESIPAQRRLFMTATPREISVRLKKAAEAKDLVLWSMDDETTYGPRFKTLAFSEAIERGLLTDYRVAIVGVTDEEVDALVRERTFVTRDAGGEVIPASELAAHVALGQTMRRFGRRRVISFHTYVKRARRFADAFPAVVEWMGSTEGPDGDVWAESVSGAMPIRDRDRVLKRLASVGPDSYGLVSNARCLGEGVDVPTIDGIAFVDPKNSPVDIVQAVGRAIRKAGSDKNMATIMLPVLVRSGEDAEAALDRSDYRAVWRVVNALRAHDDVLADELDALRFGLSRREEWSGFPAKIVLDLPEMVGREFATSLGIRIVEMATSTWHFGLGKLTRFAEKEGHARVPTSHIEDGFKLGGWVGNRRFEFRGGRLSDEQRKALEALPGWSWNPLDDDFAEGLARLRRFVEQEGHARVPKFHVVDPDGFRIGVWVNTRRYDFSRRRLSEEHKEALEALPGWSWDPAKDRFEEGVAHLRRFAKKEGHTRVPRDYEEGKFKLGKWVSALRVKLGARLNDEQREALTGISGWSWDPLEDSFQADLARLRRFAEREGHTRIAAQHVDEDGFPLGRWASRRRSQYRRGKLNRVRAEALEALLGWSWDPLEDSFEARPPSRIAP